MMRLSPALMLHWCEGCSQAWAVAFGASCPSCEESRPTVDAYDLIEQLAKEA